MAKLLGFLITSYLCACFSFSCCFGQELGCEEHACDKCFNFLVNETIYSDENQFNLQKTFFPPESSSPPFVVVDYRYRDGNGTILPVGKVWFWTTSSYYIIHPPSKLQYTSLFFAEPAFRIRTLNLTLTSDCFNISDSYMHLLTQRVSDLNFND